MEDTSLEMTEKMHEMIRSKSPIERFKMGCSMYETSRFLMIRAILQENPQISKVNIQKQLFLKFYGNDFDLIEQERILLHIEQFLVGK